MLVMVLVAAAALTSDVCVSHYQLRGSVEGIVLLAVSV